MGMIVDGDFEVFLDVLEGVITTPLKRIYKAKLRRMMIGGTELFPRTCGIL